MDPITFYIYSTYITTGNVNRQQKQLLTESLSFKMPDAENVRRFNMNRARVNKNWSDLNYWQLEWTGNKSYYKGGSFPIGFLKIVKMFLHMREQKYKVIDMRPEIEYLEKDLEFIGNLKNFQFTALKNNITESRGIIEVGTGGGKTIMGIMLMCIKNTKTTIIVPTTIVKKQWEDSIDSFVSNATIFRYGKKKNLDNEYDVMVVTASTLKSAHKGGSNKPQTIERQQAILKHLKSSFTLLIDEIHTFASEKDMEIANLCEKVYYIYGLTATSGKRSDKADIEYYGLTGQKLINISQLELVELGQTVPSKVKFYQVDPISFGSKDEWITADPSKSVEWKYIVINRNRNMLICTLAVDRAFRRGKQTLIIFNRTDHGNGLNATLEILTSRGDLTAMGYSEQSIGFIDGSTPEKHRKRILNDYNTGLIKILIAQVKVIGTGFDCPYIRCIIVAKGGKSEIQTIQIVGRGVRLDKEKEFVEVIDFADQGKYVMSHSEERFYTYHEITEDIDVDQTYLKNLV